MSNLKFSSLRYSNVWQKLILEMQIPTHLIKVPQAQAKRLLAYVKSSHTLYEIIFICGIE